MKKSNCIRGIFIENGFGFRSIGKSYELTRMRSTDKRTPKASILSTNRTLRMNKLAFIKHKWDSSKVSLRKYIANNTALQNNPQSSPNYNMSYEKLTGLSKTPNHSAKIKQLKPLPEIRKHKIIPKKKIDIPITSWADDPPFFSYNSF